MLIFILGSGIYFSLRLKGIQFSKFLLAAKKIKESRLSSGEGNITPYQALMSALSGIVGNGNIAGVATAIVIGGPGAVFWMWASALILMATMYSESLLGFKFREKEEDGTFIGGPMVYIKKALGWKWLAYAFAAAMSVKTLIATTSIQSNSMSIVMLNEFGMPQLVSCLIIAILTWLVIIGGLKKIAKTAEYLSPIMTIIYLTGGLLVIIINAENLIPVLKDIFTYAFTSKSATGGFAGASVLMALRYGAARGAYSNEAGTGSVAIMHATAQSDSPVKQSLISMMGVFIDTIIICTITALAILTAGIWTDGLNSTALTSESFASTFVFGNWIVLASSLLFGYSTLITWSFYGEQCAAFMFGDKIKKYYRWLFSSAILIGAVGNPENIWSLGDLLNGITVVINLIGIIALSPIVIKTTFENK
ncbi:MAG: amino acid carrier protein [Bacteroidetes bacterium]|nr:amino acid carrier protein [Bacteroidota bacterium]